VHALSLDLGTLTVIWPLSERFCILSC